MSASNPCKDDVAKSSSPQSEAMASAGRQRQQLPGLVWRGDGARGSGSACSTTPRWFPRPWPRTRLSPPQSCPCGCPARRYPPLHGEKQVDQNISTFKCKKTRKPGMGRGHWGWLTSATTASNFELGQLCCCCWQVHQCGVWTAVTRCPMVGLCFWHQAHCIVGKTRVFPDLTTNTSQEPFLWLPMTGACGRTAKLMDSLENRD